MGQAETPTRRRCPAACPSATSPPLAADAYLHDARRREVSHGDRAVAELLHDDNPKRGHVFDQLPMALREQRREDLLAAAVARRSAGFTHGAPLFERVDQQVEQRARLGGVAGGRDRESSAGVAERCATSASKLLAQQQAQLVTDEAATIVVTSLHLGNRKLAVAALGFRRESEGELLLEHHGRAWKINMLFAANMP